MLDCSKSNFLSKKVCLFLHKNKPFKSNKH